MAGLAPRTVSKLVDSGRLKGYRVPGSQDRRIPRNVVIKFFEEHNIPLGELEGIRVVSVGVGSGMSNQLRESLKPDFKVEEANDPFQVGYLTAERKPHCLIIDSSIGQQAAEAILAGFESSVDLIVIGVISTAKDFPRLKVTERFLKPFDTELLAQRIQSLVGVV